MPHPERFPLECDGDQIFKAMHAWITAEKSPSEVVISDLSSQALPEIKSFKVDSSAVVLEKTLIITDNEGFSVSQAARDLLGQDFSLDKSFVYAFTGASEKELTETGLVANPNKETLVNFVPKSQQILVELFEDDPALHLADQLSEQLGKTVTVRRLKAWNFSDSVGTPEIETILKNGLICNPNSGSAFMAYPDFNA